MPIYWDEKKEADVMKDWFCTLTANFEDPTQSYHIPKPTKPSKAIMRPRLGPSIIKVIFSNPATIAFWSDGEKTVVKCSGRDNFDPEKGLAMAIAKRALGNKGNYYNTFVKYIPELRDKDDIPESKDEDNE